MMRNCRVRAARQPPWLLARPYAVCTGAPVVEGKGTQKTGKTDGRVRKFKQTLDRGPSLDDFIAGRAESLEASEEAMEGSREHGVLQTSKPGYTRLPDWLKTPIPTGGNFQKIKQDLRGLGLHTVYVFQMFCIMLTTDARTRGVRILASVGADQINLLPQLPLCSWAIHVPGDAGSAV
jgi:hypothetical protein